MASSSSSSSAAAAAVAMVMMVFLSSSVPLTSGAGAGRAFPMASEIYVIQTFQRINPRLEWDPSNFLVDLSGHYAVCRLISSRGGEVRVDRRTPEGVSIVGYFDSTDGQNSDVNSVNGYLKRVIDRWSQSGSLNSYIRSADRFGCSVGPGCNGRVAVSCLFSPGEEGIPNPIEEGPKALAFTPQQYQLAESITGNRWDSSHFLENLSGMETDCAMIGSVDWSFTKARDFEQKHGMRLSGNYGYERNQGSTPDALRKILTGIKHISYARSVGCSLIPDCVYEGQMYVVISCIYQEN